MLLLTALSFQVLLDFASGFLGVGIDPSPLPALLVSGTSGNGTSMIIRIDGFPKRWMEIYREVHLLPYGYITGTNPRATAFKALATHHQNNVIFWSNPLQNDIEWMPNFIHGNVSISDVHLVATDHVNGMSADWLSHNLYWTDTQEKKIMLSSVNDPHLAQGQSPYHKRILDSNDGLDAPWGVAVDPFDGKLYWTDANKRTVNVANLDGTSNRVLYQGQYDEKPTSICLDVEEKILYWIDKNLMAIFSMGTNGQGRTHVHDYVEEHDVTLNGLAMYEDYLFTTGTGRVTAEHHDRAIVYIMNRHLTSDNLRLVLDGPLGLNNLHDVAVLAPQLQPDNGPICEHSTVTRCPHICVGYQNQHRFSCLCADGYTVRAGTDCEWNMHVPKSTRPWWHISTPPITKPTWTPPRPPTVPPRPPTMTTNPTWTSPRPPTTTARANTINPLQLRSTPSSQASTQGGIHHSVVVAIAVSIAGLVAITAIIAILICFVMKHRQKQARAAAPIPPAVVFTQQSGSVSGLSNPMYGAAERPPSYLCATAGPGAEPQYENLSNMAVASNGAFPGEVLEEKKSNIGHGEGNNGNKPTDVDV